MYSRTDTLAEPTPAGTSFKVPNHPKHLRLDHRIEGINESHLLEHFRSLTVNRTTTNRVWTVAEAKARLSEVLRLAEEEGP